jgi:threonine dehydratase
MPTADLMTAVNRHVSEEGMIFLHPFDDLKLILGYARSENIWSLK